MKRQILTLVCGLLLIAGHAHAQPLASRGHCVEAEAATLIANEVAWTFDPSSGENHAQLKWSIHDLKGTVLAVRKHDDGVKVNMRFEGNDYFSAMEAVAMKNSSVSSFAILGFQTENDQSLVSFLTGFKDARCQVR